MAKRVSRPWTEQERDEILEAQEHSGLTVAEYARREGMKPHVLYSWRHRRGARWGAVTRRRSSKRSEAQELTLVPVDLPVTDPGESTWPLDGRFTVELCSGDKLHVPVEAPVEQVEALLEVLRRCC